MKDKRWSLASDIATAVNDIESISRDLAKTQDYCEQKSSSLDVLQLSDWSQRTYFAHINDKDLIEPLLDLARKALVEQRRRQSESLLSLAKRLYEKCEELTKQYKEQTE